MVTNANNKDFISTVQAWWSTYGNIQAVMGIIALVPNNPWINLLSEMRPDRTECRDHKLTNKECEKQYNEPLRMGDEAAHFGCKSEMIVYPLVFVVYPIWVNFINGKRPTSHQLIVLVMAALVFVSVNMVRGYFVYTNSSANVHHCVDMASVIMFVLLTMAMWSVLPPPEELTKTLKDFTHQQKEFNHNLTQDYRNMSDNVTHLTSILGHLIDRDQPLDRDQLLDRAKLLN